MMAGEDVVAAKPVGGSVQQDLLQRAAVNGKLRPFVTGLEAPRLAPDRLAVFGKIGQFLGADAGSAELIEQAKLDQLAYRMRQHVDADAERLELRHAFKDADANAE